MKSVHKHNQTLRLFLSSLTLLLLFTFQLTAQEIDSTQVRNGKKIFNANCASCHKLSGTLIGPELGGVEDKRTNDWLKAWIKDNAALRASGDADAIAIFNEYNGSVMTAFPQLSDSDIDAILAYTTHGDIDKKVVVGGGEEVAKGKTINCLDDLYCTGSFVLLLLVLWVYLKSNNEFLKLVTTIALLIGNSLLRLCCHDECWCRSRI